LDDFTYVHDSLLYLFKCFCAADDIH
jgi:hypothetical protein